MTQIQTKICTIDIGSSSENKILLGTEPLKTEIQPDTMK